MTTAQIEELLIEYDRPVLYPKQQEAIFSEARTSIIEASTKSGKTVGCLVWIVEQAFPLRPRSHVWWVAPVYSQAKVAYRRLKTFLTDGGMPYNKNDTELMITLPNDVDIVFRSGEKPDSLYGEDVFAAVLDEATRMREEAFIAVRTTLTATGGPMRIIGNVKGRKNWAFRLARKAESGAIDLAHFKITAHDAVEAGVLRASEIESARRDLPESVFNELYLAMPSTDEGNPFGIDHIRKCVIPLAEAWPASNVEPVAFGWDLAKSVDWTVGVGLDEKARVVRFSRFQKPWKVTLREIRATTGRVPADVDSTGVGDPIVEDLQSSGGGNFSSFKFTQPSKQQLMEGLAVAIQRHEIGIPENSPECPIQHELEMMEYEYTRTGVRYSAPPGFHDDCVMGLALAHHRLRLKRPIQIFV
jgi:hypothetical protein